MIDVREKLNDPVRAVLIVTFLLLMLSGFVCSLAFGWTVGG